MATFHPPASIPTVWRSGGPRRFVPLDGCTGLQLAVALRHAGAVDYPALKRLWIVFTRRGGTRADTVGPTLRLPPGAPRANTKPYRAADATCRGGR